MIVPGMDEKTSSNTKAVTSGQREKSFSVVPPPATQSLGNPPPPIPGQNLTTPVPCNRKSHHGF